MRFFLFLNSSSYTSTWSLYTSNSNGNSGNASITVPAGKYMIIASSCDESGFSGCSATASSYTKWVCLASIGVSCNNDAAGGTSVYYLECSSTANVYTTTYRWGNYIAAYKL